MGRVFVIVVVSLLSACGGTTDYGSKHSDGPSDGAGAGSGSMDATVDDGGETGGSNEGGGVGNGGASGGGAATDAGTSSGGSVTIPTKNGVPIGDCTDPTPEEQAMRGCPVMAPPPESPCSAPDGTTCRYEITADAGVSSQVYFSCSPQDRTWGPGAQIVCGVSCDAPGPNVTELPGLCSDRPITSCEAGSTTTLFFPTAQQWANEVFATELRECGFMPYGNGIHVEILDGCPTRFWSDKPLNPADLACLSARLSSVRWDCALELSCVNYLVVLID